MGNTIGQLLAVILLTASCAGAPLAPDATTAAPAMVQASDAVLAHPQPQPEPRPTIVPNEPEPAPPAEGEPKYLCSDRDKMITDFLATNPSLPIVKRLPSGERVYIDEKKHVIHYDGPTCVER